jgi:hypothetical protein
VSCWLIEVKPNPLGPGVRAKVVNLTGAIEADRVTQALEAQEQTSRDHARWREREEALLAVLGIGRPITYRKVFALTPEAKRKAAAELLTLKREGHFFDDLFNLLVDVSPESFHEYLSELDPARAPESLAFAFAPLGALNRFIDVVASTREAPRRELVAGAIAGALDTHRHLTAPVDDVGAAVYALALSGRAEALAAVARTLGRLPEEERDETERVLLEAGYAIGPAGALVKVESSTAYVLRAAPKRRGRRASAAGESGGGTGAGTGIMWGTDQACCGACGALLLRVLEIDRSLVPGVVTEPGDAPLAVWTCRDCVADAAPYFVKLGPTPRSVFAEPPPADAELEVRSGGTSPPVAIVRAEPAPPRITFLLATAAEDDLLTRVGGAPSWVQQAELVTCPSCHGLWWGDTGMLYAFTCGSCRVVATLVQCL